MPDSKGKQLTLDIGRITDDHVAIGYIDGTMLIMQECRDTIDQHIRIPVTALLYAIQEYQKVYPIKFKADFSKWRGMFGTTPDRFKTTDTKWELQDDNKGTGIKDDEGSKDHRGERED